MTDPCSNREIASRTVEHLGGNRFLAMTGARDIVSIDRGVCFRLPRAGNGGVNHVKITLNDVDLYDLTFGKMRGINYSEVSTASDICAENLAGVFAETTGLDTHL